MLLRQRLLEAANTIREKTGLVPELAVILGSGLGDLADRVEDAVVLPFPSIPHFPTSTVAGHAGALVLGRLGGMPVAVMRGRVHFYEGYTMAEVTFPVRLLKTLGCTTLIVTNASGGIHGGLRAGDIVRITDHINLMGTNPLIGPNDDHFGPRFPDMSAAYDADLGDLAVRVADATGSPLKAGVFCAVTGPSYETRAEIRCFERAGADLVGMSTVPEVIVARHMGMRVVGFSCVTNVVGHATSHEEVLAVAEATRPRFVRFMQALIEALPRVTASVSKNAS